MATSDDTLMFLTAEFNAMDQDNDGKLTTTEVIQILIHQGLKPEYLNENLCKKFKGFLSKDDFVKFMKSLPASPRDLRTIFEMFHQDPKGYATKSAILLGFQTKLGIDGTKLVNAMETTGESDDLVSYENYLRVKYNSKQILS